MKISRSDCESYALSFVSFVLPKLQEIDEIILFGSSARDEADEKSDIDLFFNTKDKDNEKIIKSELGKFYRSKLFETFSQRGIKNLINFNVGDLSKWSLKRSIVSEGIVLYSRNYKSAPEKMNGFVFFNISPVKDIAKRNKVIRWLFGRKEENYSSNGFVKEVNGKKVSPTGFIVSLKDSQEVISRLKREKIDYSLFEFWSDTL